MVQYMIFFMYIFSWLEEGCFAGRFVLLDGQVLVWLFWAFWFIFVLLVLPDMVFSVNVNVHYLMMKRTG